MRILPFRRGLFKVKSNPGNMETEGAIKSVRTVKHRFTDIRLIMDTSLLWTVCFVPWERKPKVTFYMIVFSDIKTWSNSIFISPFTLRPPHSKSTVCHPHRDLQKGHVWKSRQVQ